LTNENQKHVWQGFSLAGNDKRETKKIWLSENQDVGIRKPEQQVTKEPKISYLPSAISHKLSAVCYTFSAIRDKPPAV
jgi:hypothetical protein